MWVSYTVCPPCCVARPEYDMRFLFFPSTAGNPFQKDHQREKPQGTSNSAALEAVGPHAPGLRSSTPAQTESFPCL